jgi:hypothetical protein
LNPWAWVRSKTIGKISPKNTDKLLIKDDIQPILAYSLKETLGVNFKNEKTEKGKNKFQFSIGNFSVER